ncbi:hypothetical protein [Halomonas sp. BC04]|uniref:hypothetical protein n=1 Tax=Halomonas sp. BC04 TaxID=1403540 RepID=UPI0003ED6777|nr:hypothetical protein [Halomonas sp. BC04]EWH01946.1 hypothetical protein Q427_11540 [Halomonas sp. BC04]
MIERIKQRPGLASLLDRERMEDVANKARSMAGNFWGQASERIKESGAKERVSGLIKGWTDRMR